MIVQPRGTTGTIPMAIAHAYHLARHPSGDGSSDNINNSNKQGQQ